jgi:D-xylose transport system ATP-binding protein
LGAAETGGFRDWIGRLRDQGLAVVLISHNLADVRAVADRAVVLRLGRNVGDYRVTDTSRQEIVGAILGASSILSHRRAHRPAAPKAVP